MFSIHSASSDRELIFSAFEGDYFHVKLKGVEISASARVYVYTGAHTLNTFFQELANRIAPWKDEDWWESIEGEFAISTTCSSTGQVTFLVKLSGRPSELEEWRMQAGLQTELGQLDRIAEDANAFFQAA